jgi:hypothetical protein
MPDNPQPDPLSGVPTVKVKAPGGGSVSHEGIEYKPDAEGNITIPLRVKEHIESIHHTPAVSTEPPLRVKFEPAQEKQEAQKQEPPKGTDEPAQPREQQPPQQPQVEPPAEEESHETRSQRRKRREEA